MSAKDNNNVIKVGSRKSDLALIQTRHVISLLQQLYPDKEFDIVTMTTLGDRVLNISLPKIGEKSLFTKDLEVALQNGSVDLVVHSLKDLPTTLPENMAIGAVLEREDPRDALVLREDHKGKTLATLPPGSIIGTSSLRRTAQISRNHPHLRVVDIRGNLNTRLKKLDHHVQHLSCASQDTNGSKDSSGTVSEKDTSHPDYAALILAQAGLVRMGWQNRISQVLPSEDVLYAVGQGALAIECRANNTEILQMLAPLNHPDTYCRILAERSFLRTLGGGCSAPVAISTSIKEAESSSGEPTERVLQVTGAVWSLNGRTKIQDSILHVFDERKTDAKQTCPFKTKSKASKHKLEAEVVCRANRSEGPETKISKVAADAGCPRVNRNEREVNCCRMKRMNQTIDKVEPVEIENLINIHGKLFMSCPFSEGVNGVCPVEFPIGQEVMGECPYLSDKEGDFTDTLVKMHPRKTSYDIKKCPFMSNQVVAINTAMEVNTIADVQPSAPSYDIKTESKAKNCPFLKLGTDVDCENETQSDNVERDQNCSDVSDVRLYCGLTKHFDLPETVVEECEGVGRRLAEKLIRQGALDVMKCAHDHIRSSIPANAIVAVAK